MDQPGKVANPARGQLNREHEYFPVLVSLRLRIWFHETGSAVPSGFSLLVLHNQNEACSLDPSFHQDFTFGHIIYTCVCMYL